MAPIQLRPRPQIRVDPKPTPKPPVRRKLEAKPRPRAQTPTPKVTPQGPTQLIVPPPSPAPMLVPRFTRPVDDFLQGVTRKSLYRPPEALKLPTDPTQPVTVPNVPVPGADAKPSATEAHVQLAAQALGFSREVSAIATTELARRLGGDLVVDLKSGKQQLTADHLKAADLEGDGVSPYTFSPSAIAVLKDANLAASLGLDSLEALYAKQASTVLPRLREAAIDGTDVDLGKELQLVNDPATREALGAYYELTRSTRALGHGDASAFEQLPAARQRLTDAMAKLPRGGPLNASVQALSKEVAIAQATLLEGTASAGKVPKAAIALLNNLAAPPLGKLPDDPGSIGAALIKIEEQALRNGATAPQASALRQSLELAYDLRTQGSSDAGRLAENRKKASALLSQAGPFGASARPRLEKVLSQAALAPAVAPTSTTTDPAKLHQNAELISTLADRFSLLAKGRELKGLPDALKAIKNAADAVRKGDTVEGMVAGLKAAPAVIAGMVELLRELPHLASEASALMKAMSSVLKLPFDVVGTFANAKKAVTGTDLDGKAITQAERANAAAELVLSDVPGVVGTVAGLAGTTSVVELAAAVVPVGAIGLAQTKMMILTLEEVAKMKGAMTMGTVRDRFDLGSGDDVQFRANLDGQLKAVQDAPTTRADQAVATLQALLTHQFKDVDTAARFRAFASSKLPGGRQTVQAAMRGQRIPAFIDRNVPGVSRTEGARTIEAAKQLKVLAAQFYKLEATEVRKMLDNQHSGRSGESYMTSRDERRELNHWLNR